jgi:hypothetical protein
MKPTIKELKAQVKKLTGRLSMAVVFEVVAGISIGISEEDNLWRIRRELGPYDYLFLNTVGVWETAPTDEDIQFANRTGFKDSNDAFEVYEKYAVKSPLLEPQQQVMIDMTNALQNIAKNN